MPEEKKYGELFVVSTPIGNLGDISERALNCLRAVEIIACEDTRHTGFLLSRFDIKKRLISYNDVNAIKRLPVLLDFLGDGKNVAVVSDAGTPGVCDPAYRIVRSAIDSGFEVKSIPGASAVLSALVVSGLPLDRFVFEGFLPQKGAARSKRIELLKNEPRTIIFYESPYRIINLLDSLFEILGDREISVSRELTKLHEETIRGTVGDVLSQLKNKNPRGEYTVVVRGTGKKGSS
ncbi:MAG: 16S rRNA (cytidine(1402)-2'-O)-methyltransferase [Candidatus Latescibacteria bacterium]|nr:16S rRNA (cytidine(1402)-2'-O)-methyltransferase [Candidatus Latescibacterota bacterium]